MYLHGSGRGRSALAPVWNVISAADHGYL